MLEKFRSVTKMYIETQHFPSALYWADKTVTLSKGDAKDVYILAQCMYLCGQYHRAAHLITHKKLDQKYLTCKHLAAQSLYKAELYSEGLALLELEPLWKETQSFIESDFSIIKDQNVYSSLYLLRGKIHEAMDNRILAVEDYKMALKLDVYCNEAFELLIKHQMLTADEEEELLDTLPFEEQCSGFDGEAPLIKALYFDQIKKYCKPQARYISTTITPFLSNQTIRLNYAERCLYGFDYRECFITIQEILKEDPYHEACLPVYVMCLVALKKSQILFHLAHRLVDCDPNNATAWYAVGCYYYVIGKYEEARKYFHKTTTLDRNHGTAWLMRGHAFAAENEHDQAMAAYFKASQLMKGSHLPMLYVGLEHGLMNNTSLAGNFFEQALSLAQDDPCVLHELGTVAYHNGDFVLAEKRLLQAMEKVGHISGSPMDDTWEPLLNNLGHVSRRLKKYDKAIEFHQKALLVCPSRSSTYASLGYVHALTGNIAEAVEYFHKALGIKRDDTFSTTMLNFVLESYISDAPPFPGAPSEIPLPKSPRLPEASALSRNVTEIGVSSTMETSNVSMADVSHDEILQLDTPASVSTLSRQQDESVLSGIGPLRTPSEAVVTPIAFGFGLRPAEFGFISRRRDFNEVNDEDTPVIQRR